MESNKIATIISFCSLDYKFIRQNVEEARKFSDEVIVVYTDKFFDGEDENRVILDKLKGINARLVKFRYDHTKTMQYGSRYWHNYARYAGYKAIKTNPEYIIFSDADEVFDGQKFNTWFKQKQAANTYRFLSFWYFRDPTLQATTYEEASMMIRTNAIKANTFFNPSERSGMYVNPVAHRVMLNGVPFCHHFSWARTKQEMLQKVSAWGHALDRNWKELIEEEFSHDFNGTDFVHGYSYKEVPNYFNIKL